MQFTQTQDFPADLPTLWRLFGRREFVQRKYLALDGRAAALMRFDADAGGIEVDLEREVALPERAPRWMRLAAGASQRLHQHSRWRLETPARIAVTMEVRAVGAPVGARAVGELVAIGHDAARLTLRWRVDSPAPVVGRRIEQVFADRLRAALAADQAFTLGDLARRRARLRPGG